MRLYLDSNVLIAYLRGEIDRAFNLRFLESAKFFIACGELDAELVLSELLITEVKRKIGISKSDIKDLFDGLGVKTIFAGTAAESEILTLMRSTGVHFADATHLANALNERCDCIVTLNTKHFNGAKAAIACRTPNEFIEGF